MNYTIILQDEAVADISEVFHWYDKSASGLGDNFLNEIEICFEKLEANPQYYSYINERYRRIKTNRFPYLIIYEIEGNNVIINSVRHGMQKPKF